MINARIIWRDGGTSVQRFFRNPCAIGTMRSAQHLHGTTPTLENQANATGISFNMTAHRRRLAIRLAHLPSLTRFVAAAAVGQIAWVLLPQSSWRVRLVASWDGFAVVALAVTWFTMLTLRPTHIRRVARIEDPSRLVSLVLVLLGAAASLLAVVVMLRSSAPGGESPDLGAVALALSAVVLAWTLIHTLFTLRYAHIYHGRSRGAGGLEFPGGEGCPEYLDFAYFAFVIGMTAQTSDVAILTRHMRTVVLAHAILSFAFNTAVVALSISVLTTLLQP